MADLFLRKDQIAVGIPRSGTGLNIASGTLVGVDGSGNAIQANASSGSGQVPALGWAATGENVGTWTTNQINRFDLIDSPHAILQVNSGAYTAGRTLFLSGGGSNLVNYSTTPPNNLGDIVQAVGVMVDTTRFRPKVGVPFVVVYTSGTGPAGNALRALKPWRGPMLDQ